MSNWYDGIEDRVVAAYKQHGLKAKPYDMVPGPHNPEACCAVGALCFGQVKLGSEVQDAAKALGLTDEGELWAFVCGFDCGITGTTEELGGPRGAGIRTAKAVKAAGIPHQTR